MLFYFRKLSVMFGATIVLSSNLLIASGNSTGGGVPPPPMAYSWVEKSRIGKIPPYAARKFEGIRNFIAKHIESGDIEQVRFGKFVSGNKVNSVACIKLTSIKLELIDAVNSSDEVGEFELKNILDCNQVKNFYEKE